MIELRLLPMGQDAVLAEVVGDPAGDRALGLAMAIESARGCDPAAWAGVTDVVPGATTVLLRLGAPATTASVGAAVRALAAGLSASAGAPITAEVTIEVDYDGPDLDEIGELTGLGRGGVVAAHTGTPWRVAFGGFAPGFGYLVGGDPRLHVPRRPAPRTRVPAGAVGLAGSFSGIYPRESPGGWQLLGRTDAALWDLDRDPPALLRPGTAVRFVDLRGSR